MKNKKTISIFVPHVGCPNDCVFCNQRRITNIQETVTASSVQKIITEQLKTMEFVETVELAFFGGSFTAIDQNLQIELLEAAKPFVDLGQISYIKVSTRPDAIDKKSLEILKAYKVKIIELGVQSLDEKVLLSSNRGHNSECVYKASALIKDFGFELGLQMMVGLPKDTREKVIKTAMEFVKIRPEYVRIYPVLVIKDTMLEAQLKKEEYQPITVEDTVDIVSDLIAIFQKAKIQIIRIGLQNSDSISLDNSVIAGPFHPSLGELCYSRLCRKALAKQLELLNITKGEVRIFVNNKSISKFVGNKKSNIEYFKAKNINIKFSSWDKKSCKLIYNDTIIEFDIDSLIDNISF